MESWADEGVRLAPRSRPARKVFAAGDYGLADLVLYADPGTRQLRSRKEADLTRRRHNFDLHTTMRPYFRQWYESVANLHPDRVVWRHPADGISTELLRVGRRPQRSTVQPLRSGARRALALPLTTSGTSSDVPKRGRGSPGTPWSRGLPSRAVAIAGWTCSTRPAAPTGPASPRPVRLVFRGRFLAGP